MFKNVSIDFEIPENPLNQFYLKHSNWDDWFKWRTLYYLYYVDSEGEMFEIGSLKIGEFGMVPRQPERVIPEIPNEFEELPESFFSVGMDTSYYESLNSLGEEIRESVLSALRDFSFDQDIYERAKYELVTSDSLLRGVSISTVEGQYRRLAQGEVSLSEFDFSYQLHKSRNSDIPAPIMEFHVTPNSNPPSNIQIIIGRNGVGKTHLLNNMINSILNSESRMTRYGVFSSSQGEEVNHIFSNLVSITFSAFDETIPPEDKPKRIGQIKYSYVGLKRVKKEGGESKIITKTPLMLQNEFVKSVKACKVGAKKERWKSALQTLESDTMFSRANITEIADMGLRDFEQSARDKFKNLSSGHKIVLLTITKLVECVEEKSLVLIDEPEAHLHPPLLSAFTRSLSNLLIQRNAVAIVATHSPVVLQEVPKNCVKKLRRSGLEVVIDRLNVETFGENVGVLTKEVFGLEVTNSGFHNMLTNAVNEEVGYDEVLEDFGGQIGAEGRAILNSIIYNRDNS